MEQISFFLEKFKSLGGKSIIARQVFIDTVKKIAKADVLPENVEFRSGTFYIRGISSALKSELYLKKEKIAEEMLKNLGGLKSPSIR